MRKDERIRLSKRLSYVLRHAPESVGLALDDAGWVSVDALLAALAASGTETSRDVLAQVVAESDKQRFALSDDGTRIRARQGHSVSVALGYAPATPPDLLYHGTVARFLDAIRTQGLHPRGRHHVHLSADIATARQVGQRRGTPVVLTVDAAKMVLDGHELYRTDNGVWLVATVPPGRI